MLTPTQPHNAKVPTPSPRPRPLKSPPSRKRRKFSVDVECGGKARLPGSGGGVGLGEKARVQQGGHTCVSCHRALSLVSTATTMNAPNASPANVNPTLGFKLSSAVICVICSALTCVICSRQCTSTPPPADSPPRKRTAAPMLTQTSADATAKTAIDNNTGDKTNTRRRKERDDAIESGDLDKRSGTGCGRTICRRCCVLNEITHDYTCLECYTHEPSQPERPEAANANNKWMTT